jgi:FKBP-type peptidyl-prolyl cis-trans isomerase FklB
MKNLFISAAAILLLTSCKAKKTSGEIPLAAAKDTLKIPLVAAKDTFKIQLNTLRDSFAYAYGAYVGGMLRGVSITEIDWDIFRTAYEQAMKNGDSGSLLDKEQIGEVLNTYSIESKFSGNKNRGEAYIASHKGEGYTQTASGLLFKVIKPGNGIKPRITDTVAVHYTGKLTDGKIFDSNVGKQAYKTALDGGSIKGFLEAISMMEVGSEIEVIVPWYLAYGKKGMSNPYTGEMDMEPYQTLIFTITLDKIVK